MLGNRNENKPECSMPTARLLQCAVASRHSLTSSQHWAKPAGSKIHTLPTTWHRKQCSERRSAWAKQTTVTLASFRSAWCNVNPAATDVPQPDQTHWPWSLCVCVCVTPLLHLRRESLASDTGRVAVSPEGVTSLWHWRRSLSADHGCQGCWWPSNPRRHLKSRSETSL